jgi:hypothetical protein
MLGKVAEDIVGARHAGELMEAWSDFQKAQIHYEDTRIEGLVWTSVNQRWINRPFVLFPHELTEEEKGYFRPYQFQANDEAQANDLLNMQCTSFIRGSYAVGLASNALEKAMERIQCAADSIRRIGERTNGELSEKLHLMADRLLLLNCFFKNAIHAMRFQDIIDSSDYDTEPEISPRWPIDADPKLLEYEALTRVEIDNTLRIIELIEGRVDQMLITAPTEELEDIFLLSPRLVDQLRKKIDIILDHQLDGKRLFVSPNK